MRTIKFRGKDIETGEWVYGHFFQRLGHYPAIVEPRPRDGKVMYYEIAVEDTTVGQFTGLLDKNGKEIYEGDIVDAWSAGGHLPNGIIKWGEGIAGFFIMPPKCNAVWHLVGNDENKETLEVLGNIHDNPELLKGGNNED